MKGPREMPSTCHEPNKYILRIKEGILTFSLYSFGRNFVFAFRICEIRSYAEGDELADVRFFL